MPSVVATRDVKGRVKLHQIHDLTASGAISGGLWGTLIGLIFLSPGLGFVVGAASGAISGALADIGIDDAFMKELAKNLLPESSALFIIAQGPDINVTDGGQKAPVNLRDVWILQNRLSGEEVDDILGQTRTLIDTDGSLGPIANTGIHSELGRQLSVLMKASEDIFTSDKSVDGIFDDLFIATRLCQIGTFLHRGEPIDDTDVIKSYTALAPGSGWRANPPIIVSDPAVGPVSASGDQSCESFTILLESIPETLRVK